MFATDKFSNTLNVHFLMWINRCITLFLLLYIIDVSIKGIKLYNHAILRECMSLLWGYISYCHWGGAEYVTPEYVILACGLFWAESNQDPEIQEELLPLL